MRRAALILAPVVFVAVVLAVWEAACRVLGVAEFFLPTPSAIALALVRNAPLLFVAAYAVWVILEACGNAFAMFLNGTGIVRQQINVVMLFVMIALPLKLVLVGSMGLLVMPSATIIAYIISTVGLYSMVYFKDIRQRLV